MIGMNNSDKLYKVVVRVRYIQRGIRCYYHD